MKQLRLLSPLSNPLALRALTSTSTAAASPQIFSSYSTVPSLLPMLISADKKESTKLSLTQGELSKINLLIPRLCLSNHLNTAIHLTITALFASPPPKSISFSVLCHSLTLQPDLKLPMSLLTRLKHSPQTHPYLKPITTLLITSYLKKDRPKDALKVYSWIIRPGSPCKAEKSVYGVLVCGVCRRGLVLEGLSVLRDMVEMGFRPGDDLRKRIIRSLLREARIPEAKELDKALGCIGIDDESVKKLLNLLDVFIRNWTE